MCIRDRYITPYGVVPVANSGTCKHLDTAHNLFLVCESMSHLQTHRYEELSVYTWSYQSYHFFNERSLINFPWHFLPSAFHGQRRIPMNIVLFIIWHYKLNSQWTIYFRSKKCLTNLTFSYSNEISWSKKMISIPTPTTSLWFKKAAFLFL